MTVISVYASAFWPAMWQPKIQFDGLVVDLATVGLVVGAVSIPFVCGMLSRRQPILAALLVLLFILYLIVQSAFYGFFAISKHGEPIPFNWRWFDTDFLWLVPGFVLGNVSVRVFERCFRGRVT
jgi:hypothetical protein